MWIGGGLCSDLWFNGQIFRWWLSFSSLPDLVFGVFGGGLMVYAQFGMAVGGLHFPVFFRSKHLKIFYGQIFYSKIFYI